MAKRLGYLCIQGYPNRICSGCTSGCNEPVYVEPVYVSATDPDLVKRLRERLPGG